MVFKCIICVKKRQFKPILSSKNMLSTLNYKKALIISYQKMFFLEFTGRGGVGQMLTKADEGGEGGSSGKILVYGI